MNNMINATTILTGLLGHPVRHSISPRMHNEAFRLLGLDYAYLCFDVDETHLGEAVAELRALGARGFNLTMPNKNRVLDYLDETKGAASLVHAVNTVVCENGRLTGYITDGIGFFRGLRDTGFEPAGKKITVLGSGGAACAIIAQAVLEKAAEIRVFFRPSSRYAPRMEKLAEDAAAMQGECRLTLHDLADQDGLGASILESDLLVNATSVGMGKGSQDTLIHDLSLFSPRLRVADVIYEPIRTRLLEDASRAGCNVMNGLPMLLYQGAEAFRLWTGQNMPVDEIRRTVFGYQDKAF